MIAATVTVNPGGGAPNVGTDLFSLINAATPGQVADNSVRVAEIHMKVKSAGAIQLVYKPGAVTTATDAGFEFFASTAGQEDLHFGPYTANQISLKDIFLSAATEQTLWVTANII